MLFRSQGTIQYVCPSIIHGLPVTEESRTAVAETLDAVYGLVNDMQVVMEGTRG